MEERALGWIRDDYDPRDLEYGPKLKATELPASVDLRANMPPVWSQGRLGACTAFAILGAYQYLSIKQDEPVDLSQLFLYYCERDKERNVEEDSGARIRTGMKLMKKMGCCKSELHPYNPANFKIKPTAAAYEDAANQQTISYQRVRPNLYSIKAALAEGLPVVFGATLFASFMTKDVTRSGVVPLPAKGEPKSGGHAMLLVGYNDDMNVFLVRNSWSEGWGMHGYSWMPYDYVANNKLCDDFWIIQSIKTTSMQLHSKEELAKLSPAEIIALVETGLSWLLNTIKTSKPLMGWRKEQEEEIDLLKQQLAGVSTIALDTQKDLAATKQELAALKKFVEENLPAKPAE